MSSPHPTLSLTGPAFHSYDTEQSYTNVTGATIKLHHSTNSRCNGELELPSIVEKNYQLCKRIRVVSDIIPVKTVEKNEKEIPLLL